MSAPVSNPTETTSADASATMTATAGPARTLLPRRGLRRLGFWLVGLVPIALGLLAWEALTEPNARSFPPPSSWWEAERSMWEAGTLGPALASTLTTFALSMVLATVLGVGLGILVGSKPRVERALMPLIDFFRALPPPVIVPVLTLLLGINRGASVAIVVAAVVWPIVLSTMTAVQEVPSVRREVAPVLGLGRLETFVKVTLPSLTVGIVTGVRISIGLALVITLLVDILSTGTGIGRLLVEQQQFFESAAVWALLFTVGLIGYAINLLIQAATAVALRNHPERRAT